MKKKLLGFGLVLLPFLVVVYYVEMTQGWYEAMKIINVTMLMLGILVLFLLLIIGIGLLLGADWED